MKAPCELLTPARPTAVCLLSQPGCQLHCSFFLPGCFWWLPEKDRSGTLGHSTTSDDPAPPGQHDSGRFIYLFIYLLTSLVAAHGKVINISSENLQMLV